MNTRILLILCLIVALGCTRGDMDAEKEKRWYTLSQVEGGRDVFEKHCAVCHGDQAQGTANWKAILPDGFFPPPPLNGTAHAWHHSLTVLKRTIDEGGAALGGKMPEFEGRLTEEEKLAAIAYFQNMWGDNIYSIWLQQGGLE